MSFNIIRIGFEILDLLTTQIYKHHELEPFKCEIYNFGDRKIIDVKTKINDHLIIQIIKSDDGGLLVHISNPSERIKINDILTDDVKNYDDTELLYLLGKKITDERFDNHDKLLQILIEARNKL